MFGWNSPLSESQAAEIAAAKRLVYDGFLSALAAGAPKDEAGVLVDEQFGAAILRDAAAAGIVTACSAEKSGRGEFDFEYGEDFAKHIDSLRPTFCKVLVRYNPEGDKEMNQRQAARLRRLSDDLARAGRSRLRFELLVPPEKAQLEKRKSDKGAYDRELRPQLMVGAIDELQRAGVDPDVWKIEGLDRREDCEQIVAAARASRRASVGCIILGRGENEARCGSGWQRPRASSASSALPSAERSFGIPSRTGVAGRRRARLRSVKSPAATGSLSQLSRPPRTAPSLTRQRDRRCTTTLAKEDCRAARNDRPRPDGS